MKTVLGIEIGAVLCIDLVAEDGRIVGRAVEEIPSRDDARADAIEPALISALTRLPAEAYFEAVGVAVSPPLEPVMARIADNGAFRTGLPRIGGLHPNFVGIDVEALYTFYGGGESKAWLILGDRPRLYVEGAEYGDELQCVDEKGIARAIRMAVCGDLLLPLKSLRNSFGLFENLNEIEDTASLVRNSDGVRMAVRSDGLAIFGVDSIRGIRRPQLCRAALESVAAEVRYAIAELAGEGVVRELYVAGPASRNALLLELISDFSGVPVVRSETRDAIACGAACRAAEAREIRIRRPERSRFIPSMAAVQRDELYARWLLARGE